MSDRTLRIPALRLGLRGGRFGLALGIVLLMAFVLLGFAPLFLDIPPPEKMDLLSRLAPPSAAHPLGADHLGRDVLARLIGAVPISLGAALAAMAAILAISLPWGIAAGLAGGKVDMAMMRLADIIMAFPTLVLALAVIGFMGASLEASIVGVAAAWWPSNARLVRALVLSASQRDFVRAARLAEPRACGRCGVTSCPRCCPLSPSSFHWRLPRSCWRCHRSAFLGLAPSPPRRNGARC